MYDLGEYFKFDLNKSKSNSECTFKGNKYRITVLTERLVRLEYNENGLFNDYPTELVWYRNFNKPEFTIDETDKVLKITTKYFELTYLKEKKFEGSKLSPMSNLKIKLLNSDKIWYYKHPEVRNFLSSTFILNDSINYQKGLYSIDGFASIDDSKSSLILENGSFKKRDNIGIDTYVFLYNKDFYYCLNDYFMLTGYPPLIPRYALGNWWVKDELYNEVDIAHIIKKFEMNNIPISMFLLNRWHNDSYNPSDTFKDISMLIKYFNSKNIKLGLALNDVNSFKKGSVVNDKLKQYVPVDKNGDIPFNLFDTRTIDAYLKLLITPLTNIGINFYSINSFNKNELVRLMMLKHYLYYNNFKDKRHIISGYNSKIASHRYPVIYSGDTTVCWESLKKIPKLLTTSSNLGVSFITYDIGGTKDGIEDNELFTRYVQLGVFSPILRLGSNSGKYYKREPWKWGLKTTKIVTDYLNLRYKLIPYIYTESYKYSKYGKPLIEPIYYKYPELYDDSLYNNEYYFGSSFLISPITTKKDYIMNRVIQKIFIPEGIWYDYLSGKKFIGNKKYVSFYKDEEYPIFVKAGSIIPASLNKFNDTKNPNTLELQVFPGDSNTYSIYEDDGETNNYQKGEYFITNVEFVYEKNNYKLTVLPVSGKTGIIDKTRNYKIRFRNTKQASKILSYVGNTQVQNVSYEDDTDLIIEVNNVPTNSQLTIMCSGDNIEIDALRIINEDIVSIISDLPIKTTMKQRVDDIMFSHEYTLKKKRIEIRKLAHVNDYLEKKYINLFLKLLEYINEL